MAQVSILCAAESEVVIGRHTADNRREKDKPNQVPGVWRLIVEPRMPSMARISQSRTIKNNYTPEPPIFKPSIAHVCVNPYQVSFFYSIFAGLMIRFDRKMETTEDSGDFEHSCMKIGDATHDQERQ